MFDKNYYDERKKELQDEYTAFVLDTYGEIERLVAKKIGKQNQFTQKMNELNARMEKSKKDSETKKEETKVPDVEPKPEDNTVK